MPDHPLIGKPVHIDGEPKDYIVTEVHGTLGCGCVSASAIPGHFFEFGADGWKSRDNLGYAYRQCRHAKEPSK